MVVALDQKSSQHPDAADYDKHQNQRADQKYHLRENNFSSLRRGGKDIGHRTAVDLAGNQIVRSHDCINDRKQESGNFVKDATNDQMVDV